MERAKVDEWAELHLTVARLTRERDAHRAQADVAIKEHDRMAAMLRAAEAEVARLEGLNDVSERKLGEWRDRGAEIERLRGLLERASLIVVEMDHYHGEETSRLAQEIHAVLAAEVCGCFDCIRGRSH